MIKLIDYDYVSSINCDIHSLIIHSLIDKNCFWTLWIVVLIWLCMMELKLCVMS